jgi:hypothetical protein
VPITLIASLVFATLRLDAVTALARAFATTAECPSCIGHGDVPGALHAHNPLGCVPCPGCDGSGERVVSAWDADRDAASRELLSLTLVRRDVKPAARVAAMKLRASLDATVRATLGQRGCHVCFSLRHHTEFDPDGVCIFCHAERAEFAAERRDAALADFEARLEGWPVTPPSLTWRRDAERTLELAGVA